MSGTEATELLTAVRQFLRQDILPGMEGFNGYQVRVAANVLGIVGRELEMGAGLVALDEAIAVALGLDIEAGPVSRQIALALRDDTLVEDDQLRAYLRRRAQLAIAIDNPKYSSLQQATARWGDPGKP